MSYVCLTRLHQHRSIQQMEACQQLCVIQLFIWTLPTVFTMIHAMPVISLIILGNNEMIDKQPPIWGLSKSKWVKFGHLCPMKLTLNNIEAAENFAETLIAIAKECLPPKVGRWI